MIRLIYKRGCLEPDFRTAVIQSIIRILMRMP